MRPAIRMFHLWVALAAGLFVVLLGVTGSIMAFEPELDHLVHRDLWRVTPGGAARPLEQIVAAAVAVHPGLAASALEVATAPTLADRVALPGVSVYVNPYTAAVIGERSSAPDWLARIHQLHLRLAWMTRPDAGKALVTWLCVAMLFLLASGVYLWWPLQRFSVAWRASRRRRWLDVHASTGIAVVGFLALAGLTGVLIGFGDRAEPVLYRLTNSAPSAHAPHVVTPQPGGAVSLDRVMDIARATVPGATPFLIAIPKPEGVFSVRLRFPEDLTPGGRSRVEIDQYSGEVVFAESSRTAPAGTRAVTLNRAIHTGDVFGLTSKFVMSLASALTAVMAVSGLMTWWARIAPRR